MGRKVLPPKLPLRFFRWFCHPDYLEDIEGDLLERFEKRRQEGKAARWLFALDVLRLFRPGIIYLPIKYPNTMLRHNLTISYRTLIRNKSNSLINIGGLTLGMMVAILIGLWVHDELSYNKNHKNYPYLAKVLRNNDWQGSTIETDASMVTGLGTLLKSEYGNYFEAVGIVRQRVEERLLSVGNRKFTQGGYFVQPEIPEMLTLDMLYGSRDGLADMNSILLSESVSRKLFGDENPVGEVVQMDARWSLKVTGVYKDIPDNSEFSEATYFSTLDRYIQGWGSLNAWDNYFVRIYVQVKPQFDFDEVSAVISEAMQSHVSEDTGNIWIFLQPMREWHLYSTFENGEVKTSLKLKFVWFYTLIGIFILVLACINFTNLSTARSEKRAKEIGIRKTMGSKKGQLINQFLSESLLIGTIAFVVSLLAAWVVLPWFNELSDKDLQIPFRNPWFWLAGMIFTILTSLLAGSYPAFYLSSLKVLRVLKGNAAPAHSGFLAALPRKALVVFQFTVSITLIIGTIVVHKQIQLAKNRPVGYEKEYLISLHQRSPEYRAKYHVLREKLLKSGFVSEVGSSNYAVTSTLGWNSGFSWDEKDPAFNPSFNTIRISQGYGCAVGLKFVAGRDFSGDLDDEGRSVLINESALELMGLSSPVGSKLYFDSNNFGGNNFTIVGVVKDMVKGSPFEPTAPSIMFLSDQPMDNLYIRLKPNINIHRALAGIGTIFEELIPTAIFDYQFVDEAYGRKFRSEERIGQLATYFAIITIFISCLGLFGLSSFITEQRAKEIGIRKVLGATLAHVLIILNQNLARLLLLSFILAVGIGYYVMDKWLENFAIKTSLSWWIFMVSGLFAVGIAFTISSWFGLKVANRNPSETLRYE